MSETRKPLRLLRTPVGELVEMDECEMRTLYPEETVERLRDALQAIIDTVEVWEWIPERGDVQEIARAGLENRDWWRGTNPREYGGK